MIKLLVLKNNKIIEECELSENPLTVGSSESADVFLSSDSVAKEHAMVSLLGGRILVEDLGSKFGTFINEKRVASNFVDLNDEIKIGPFVLKIAKPELKKEKAVTSAQNPALRDWLLDEKNEVVKPKEKKFNKFDEQKTEQYTEEDKNFNKVSVDPAQFKSTEHIITEDKIPDDTKDGKTVVIPLLIAPRLYLANREAEKRFFALNKDKILIGRSDDADIPIEDFSLSLKHAMIIKAGNNFTIVDQESTNGTKVNGEPTTERLLKCHDIIEVGDIKLEFLEGAVKPLSGTGVFSAIDGKIQDENKGDTQAGIKLSSKAKSSFLNQKRTILYLSALIIAGSFLGLNYFKSKHPKPVVIPTKPPEAVKTVDPQNAEKEKIILFNLNKSKEFLSKKLYAEAREPLQIILKNTDPLNKEAARLLAKIDETQAVEKKQEEEERKAKEERNAKISLLISKGKNLIHENRLKEAKDTFNELLTINPGDKTAASALSQIKNLEVKQVKEKEVLKGKQKEIEALYYQGVSYYEEGNYDSAAEVLKKVVEFKSTSFFQSASKILTDIDKKQVSDIEEQLSEVDSLVKNDELLKAENILKNTLKRFPDNPKAIDIYAKLHKQVVEKAKKLYTEALVYEEVVEDIKLATENYEEVLKLLPDPNEEYHQKAKARIQKLK